MSEVNGASSQRLLSSICVYEKQVFHTWIVWIISCPFVLQVLKSLRTAEFKPYIIFVRTRLHESHRKPLGSLSSLSLGISVRHLFTGRFYCTLPQRIGRTRNCCLILLTTSFFITAQEEDLQDMKQSAERIDEFYGHWVDYVLVKEDPASAFAELQLVLERLHVEPQWVPVSWVRH